eukprot:Mrub_00467.p1 GENE.Mrub_00467~~Mrub_00467.p1  ORF type:complete len:967 (-),score=266.46 Mrub_00467:16-2916(-)
MQQEILNNQNRILEEQHKMIKDQQSTMQHLISQSAPGDKIDRIKDELKQQTADFQNTFYSQTYNMVNNFNDHLVKFQGLNEEFAKYRDANEKIIADLKTQLSSRSEPAFNARSVSQAVTEAFANNKDPNATYEQAMKTFDPNQLDEFTSGLSQMKDYIDGMKTYYEKTDKEMQQRFKKMMEEQNAIKQFHYDHYEQNQRNSNFIKDMRANYIPYDYDYSAVDVFMDEIRRDKMSIIRDYSNSFYELPGSTTAEKKSKDKLNKIQSKIEQNYDAGNKKAMGGVKNKGKDQTDTGAVLTSPYYANNYANSLKNMVNLQTMMMENLNYMNENMNQNIEISHQNLVKQQQIFSKYGNQTQPETPQPKNYTNQNNGASDVDLIAIKVIEKLGGILNLNQNFNKPNPNNLNQSQINENKQELLNDLIKQEMRNSQTFASADDYNSQTNINAYLTKEQIEQLQEDGISVSESELANLHQEVLKEQGISLEESIDYEARLFGTKNKTKNSYGKSTSTTAATKSNIGRLNESKNKNSKLNANASYNKPNFDKKKFQYDIDSSLDSFQQVQTKPKFQTQNQKGMKYQSSEEKLNSNLSSSTPKNTNQYNVNMMTQLGVKSLPVKVNLEQVNLVDDSFLKDNDLTLLEFSSSYNTDDEDDKKKTKFARNLNDFRTTYEGSKGVDVDIDINLKNKVDQKENEVKRKTEKQMITKNLNYTNEMMLLNYNDEFTEEESSASYIQNKPDTKKMKYKYAENSYDGLEQVKEDSREVKSLNTTMDKNNDKSMSKEMSQSMHSVHYNKSAKSDINTLKQSDLKSEINYRDNNKNDIEKSRMSNLSNMSGKTVINEASNVKTNKGNVSNNQSSNMNTNVKPKVNLDNLNNYTNDSFESLAFSKMDNKSNLDSKYDNSNKNSYMKENKQNPNKFNNYGSFKSQEDKLIDEEIRSNDDSAELKQSNEKGNKSINQSYDEYSNTFTNN